MAHGQPDFGMYAPKTTVYSQLDMAELAARLGSIITYDRRGDLVWCDDFELPYIRWVATPSGVGGVIALDNSIARSGNQSLKITGSTSDGGTSRIERNFPVLNPSKLGFEVSFALNEVGLEFDLFLFMYDGTTRMLGNIRYSTVTGKLQLDDENGDMQDIVTITLQRGTKYLHTMKLVVDYNTGLYVRLLLDTVDYDISAYGLQSAANATAPLIYIWYRNKTKAVGEAHDIYLDDFVLTQNEP